MAASPSGKTEIAKILDQNFNLHKVITHTTREMRINEKNNIDYHFVDKKTFLAMKENHRFIETTVYNDNFYGTSIDEIDDNKCIVLDPNGANNLKQMKLKNIFIVYLNCDECIRIARMHSRNDKEDKIKSRIQSDSYSFNKNTKSIADLCIDSNQLTPKDLASIIYEKYQGFLKANQ